MANFRLSLKNHEQKQRQTAALMKAQKRMVLIEKLAGQRHHLLGTISNPGIYTNKPKSPPVKVRQADELSSGKAPIIIPEIQIRENPELKKYVAVNLKKSRMEVLRKHVEEEPAPELAQKAAQGPFLVCNFVV